jgi:small-conductance mechanosensitive channel
MVPSRRPESEQVPLVWDLISDNNSLEGKVVTTVMIVAIAIVVGTVVGRVWSRRVDDRYRKYYARKIVHYVVVAVTLIGLGILWRPFAGQLGLVLGLVAAGIAIGLHNLIGSLAGWFTIQSGSIFRVGDRVDVAGCGAM